MTLQEWILADYRRLQQAQKEGLAHPDPDFTTAPLDLEPVMAEFMLLLADEGQA